MAKTDVKNDKGKSNIVDKKKSDKKSSKPKKVSKQQALLDEQVQKNETLELQVQQLTETIKNQEEGVKSAKEESLRSMAELENFKKRKNNEVDSFKKFAKEEAVREFLPILDNFSIACEHANKEDQNQTETIKGFVMISKQIESVLEKLDVKVIDAANQPFDPNFHQAIGQEKQDDVESNVVIKEVQKGFLLHDRVIRPAMVIVSE